MTAHLWGRQVDLIEKDPVAMAQRLHQSALFECKGKAALCHLCRSLSSCHALRKPCPLLPAQSNPHQQLHAQHFSCTQELQRASCSRLGGTYGAKAESQTHNQRDSFQDWQSLPVIGHAPYQGSLILRLCLPESICEALHPFACALCVR